VKPATDISSFDLAGATATGALAPDRRHAISRSTAATPSRLRDLYELTKPRMNFLVLCTTAVGFYMAPKAAASQWIVLIYALLGTALTAASAAIINQLVERDFDALMPRTQDRPLPAGRVSSAEALALGVATGVLGVAGLALMVNPLTAILGAITLTSYVAIYTPLKRITSLKTIIGAVPGAIPPVMGWTAATSTLGPEALALFVILFLWQMPHFLAIAILYKRDYAAGGFKMLPVVDQPDLKMTGRMITLYGLALIPASILPALVHMSGVVYFTAALLLGLGFLSYCVSCSVTRQRTDARKLFFASIIYLPVLLAFMMLDKTR
jgi:protoheme IX farnesyltransferase